MMRLPLALACLAVLAAPARAEVVSAEPASFLLEQSHEFASPAKDVWSAVVRPTSWWSGEHTYSGDAANLSLKAQADGCYCERWGKNTVEHARVIVAMPASTLRLDGAFGPLQEMAVTGIMTFTLAEENGRTRLTLSYHVSGAAGDKLDQLAPLVDQVLGEQFTRLSKLIETGSPE